MNNIINSSNILLAKPTLPPDFIDCSVGEPIIIRDNLSSLFDLSSFGHMSDIEDFEYQKPNGHPSLVKELEDQYQAPVIVCNGAKQAIGALLYSIKKNIGNKIGLRAPYWGLFNPLINMHGCHQVSSLEDSDAYLMVHPNNPDGYLFNDSEIKQITDYCKSNNKILIHDAAYYSHVYLPDNYVLSPIGDVQVFTLSKLYGLSGLRVGYIVFHNTDLYQGVMEYMEHMTVGVSSVSQLYAYDLIYEMRNREKATLTFEQKCYADLQRNKKLLSKINSSVLKTDNIINIPGMFLWAPCSNFEAFVKAKINIIEGSPFGAPGFVRMNLALPEYKIKEIVQRLNKS